MRPICFKLPDDERSYLTSRANQECISVSAYLRRLIKNDVERADSDALMALSLDELARTQQEQTRHLNEIQRYFPKVLQSVSDQLQAITIEQAQSAERQLQLHQRSLEAYNGTADLVVAALDQCQTIIDADNAILESIDRRLKPGGR